jgi:ribosomal protein S18 acetylase RimI-like enzyme
LKIRFVGQDDERVVPLAAKLRRDHLFSLMYTDTRHEQYSPVRFQISLPIEIRPLRSDDLDGLEWDSREAIQADYVRKTVAERGDDVVFLLALANAQPVGLLGVDFGRKAEEGIVHLWAFGVLPSLQRLGIGTAMMLAAESLIAAEPRGANLVEVGVDEGNQDAAKLYRRLGYRDQGVERGRNDEVILLLRRSLAEIRDEGAGQNLG